MQQKLGNSVKQLYSNKKITKKEINKISHKDIMQHRNIASIHSNYKCSITFKICECILFTCNILYINYTSIFKEREFKKRKERKKGIMVVSWEIPMEQILKSEIPKDVTSDRNNIHLAISGDLLIAEE